MSTTREQFVDKIKTALGPRSGAVPPPPAVTDDLARLTADDEPLAELFIERATALGMHVHQCSGGELRGKLIEILRGLEITSVTTAMDRLDQKDALHQALAEANIEVREWRGDREMKSGYEVGAGVTDVAAALAESGSLVYASDDQHGRSLMLVPPVHVAIVRQSDLLADMLDYLRRLNATSPADLPASQTIITGPSKTADIEGVLITGVHGPGAVHILYVGDA